MLLPIKKRVFLGVCLCCIGVYLYRLLRERAAVLVSERAAVPSPALLV